MSVPRGLNGLNSFYHNEIMIIDHLPTLLASSSAATLALPSPSAHALFAPGPLIGLCGRLAAPASLLVSAAPLPTISKIKSENDVGDLPLLPYSCMACNCILWTCYGALRDAPSIWMPNGLSFLLALYYMHSFVENSAKQSMNDDRSIEIQMKAVTCIVGAAGLAFHYECPEAVGSAAVLLCMALFASPLSTLKTVVETKSAESIPLPFTVASLLACFCWSVTGFLELHDINVIVPNFTGFLFGLAQLGLKLLYRGDETNNLLGSSEMNLGIPSKFIDEMILKREETTISL